MPNLRLPAQSVVQAAGTTRVVQSYGSVQTLYSFQGSPDGDRAYASLIDVGGTLYGTTGYGGSVNSASCQPSGCGTVFSISPSGLESTIYAFQGASDGQTPLAGLTNVNGVLYGTTSSGGAFGNGTVFAVGTTGNEQVLYSFKGGTDAGSPQSGLTDVNGVLYGTSEYPPTIFKVTTSGAEKVLYTFPSNVLVGNISNLAAANGVLYGTTSNGGTLGGACGQNGCGTVFKITTAGKETTLYNFQGGTDGSDPVFGPLLNVSGILYGTTQTGGTGSKCGNGCGTVFKITTTGQESVIYDFKNSSDGSIPIAGLIAVNGSLYGTSSGGTGSGTGVVFKMNTSGKLVGTFDCGTNAVPCSSWGALLNVGGILYGTTNFGGPANDGTVFSFTP